MEFPRGERSTRASGWGVASQAGCLLHLPAPSLPPSMPPCHLEPFVSFVDIQPPTNFYWRFTKYSNCDRGSCIGDCSPYRT